MVFQYKRVLISGTQEGVEGVSAGLQEISTFMQSCGWTLVDDRSAEPGTAVDSTHHKLVFSSNGEEGNYPTFFLTMYSGTTAAVNSNLLTATVHTAYDLGSNTTPASGVRSGASDTAIGPSQNGLNIRSQDDNTELYMSGDSEMVHIISRRENLNASASTMDNIYFGRFNSFTPIEENPYPLLVAGAGIVITTTNVSTVRGIGGQPPSSFGNNSEMEVIVRTLTDAQQPYSMGSVDSIFFAMPMVVTYDDASPVRAGVAGTVRNGWLGADATSLLNLSILTASGSFGVQEYQSFTSATTTNTPSIIVRKS